MPPQQLKGGFDIAHGCLDFVFHLIVPLNLSVILSVAKDPQVFQINEILRCAQDDKESLIPDFQ